MHPGSVLTVFFLECGDLGGPLQGHGNFVEALRRRLTSGRFDGKGMALARWRRDREVHQIDADAAGALAHFHLACQALDNVAVEHHWQYAVLKAVVEEDIAEARADQTAHTHLLQRPHGSLA